jgi:dolichol-phosphate mannosyltransferase
MNSKQVQVALILPTLNEKANLKYLLPKILEIQAVSIVIIVDDNSTDGSKEYFKELQDRRVIVINRPSRLGIGSAHLDGLIKAKAMGADLVITMDADGTHRTEDLKRIIDLQGNYDILVGSRYEEGGEISGWGIYRYLLTKIGHVATSVFFKTDLDMSSGMRAYKALSIPLERLKENCSHDYSFFFISLLVYRQANLKIAQIPIKLSFRQNGSSKMAPTLMLRGVYMLFLYGTKIKRIT